MNTISTDSPPRVLWRRLFKILGVGGVAGIIALAADTKSLLSCDSTPSTQVQVEQTVETTNEAEQPEGVAPGRDAIGSSSTIDKSETEVHLEDNSKAETTAKDNGTNISARDIGQLHIHAPQPEQPLAQPARKRASVKVPDEQQAPESAPLAEQATPTEANATPAPRTSVQLGVNNGQVCVGSSCTQTR